jgi:dGTPase
MGWDHVRLRIERDEERLSPLAAKSRFTRGRLSPEAPSPTRAAFQRDRDRIVHCNAFRRMKHKTQVFISPQGDHYSTRLTHTLEVAQIARSIARALNLNEDLTEAVACGHDLGHTPFGHAGEEALNQLYPDGFRHSEQSLRVVEVLERDGQGLNLTWETRNGILCHSKPRESVAALGTGLAATIEGQVVKLSDCIAYINHDIGDAVRAGLISEDGLPKECLTVLGLNHSQRITNMVNDVIASSWEGVRASESSREQTEASYAADRAYVARLAGEGEALCVMSPVMLAATDTVREFLFARVYAGSPAKQEEKVRLVLESLYNYYCQHPQELPVEFEAALAEEKVERVVCDYLSGMTDRYALKTYENLYIPSLWSEDV